MRCLVALLLPLLLCSCAAAAATPPPIGYYAQDLLAHRLSGEDSILVTGPLDGSHWSGVEVQVTIAPSGEVVDAKAAEDWPVKASDLVPVLAAARKWRFRPFVYRGVAVAARGSLRFSYEAKGEWASAISDFPAIDYSNLRIGLTRSACFGSCPDYSLTIDGAGNAVFTTPDLPPDQRGKEPFDGVLIPGTHTSRIDRAKLDALIARFRAARFFALKKRYVAEITDSPTKILSFSSGGREHAVTDYVGPSVGMPEVVTELERAVDAAAGTARWVKGTEEAVPALAADGFQFASEAGALLAATVANRSAYDRDEEAKMQSEAFLVALIDRGVPLDRRVEDRSGAARLGEILLRSAILNNRPRLLARLAADGWLNRLSRESLSSAFAQGAGGCSDASIRTLVAAGADPNAQQPGKDGGTALFAAVSRDRPCAKAERIAAVRALVAAGADPNARDAKGRTILYHVSEEELQEALLDLGARADVRDNAGRSPAFSSWTDRIVLGLLDSGASPEGKDEGGTLRQAARKHKMLAVLDWLDAHQRPLPHRPSP